MTCHHQHGYTQLTMVTPSSLRRWHPREKWHQSGTEAASQETPTATHGETNAGSHAGELLSLCRKHRRLSKFNPLIFQSYDESILWLMVHGGPGSKQPMTCGFVVDPFVADDSYGPFLGILMTHQKRSQKRSERQFRGNRKYLGLSMMGTMDGYSTAIQKIHGAVAMHKHGENHGKLVQARCPPWGARIASKFQKRS